MKIKKDTNTKWLASDTARGIKVTLLVNREKYNLGGNELFFETIEEVKKHCKGEIVFTKRKVQVSKSKIISD